MFDISLGELAIVGAVALVVIGPEKLPKVARTAGMLFGRAQRMVASVKADLDRELRNAELAQLQAEVDKEAAAIKDEFSIPAQEAWSEEVASSAPQNGIVEAPASPAQQSDVIEMPAPSEPQPDVIETPADFSDATRSRFEADERQLDLFAEPVPAPADDGRDRR